MIQTHTINQKKKETQTKKQARKKEACHASHKKYIDQNSTMAVHQALEEHQARIETRLHLTYWTQRQNRKPKQAQ